MRKFLFGFEGRIGRATYWAVLLAILLVDACVFGALGGFELLDGDTLIVERKGPTRWWAALAALPSLWIGFVISVKRWHDRNKSGRWMLINLVPVGGWLWAFVECGCLRGTVGPNLYGQDPLRGVTKGWW